MSYFRTRLQQHFCEACRLVFSDMIGHRSDFMQRRAAKATNDIRIASAENQTRARKVSRPAEILVTGIQPRDMVPKTHRLRDHAEPARVVAWPIDSFECHSDALRIAPHSRKTQDF